MKKISLNDDSYWKLLEIKAKLKCGTWKETIEKLEKQIKKSKDKIRDRRTGARAKNKNIMDIEINLPEEELERQVKIKNIEYKPMDVEEAVLQMDLLNDNFLVFTNARSDQVNVLYRRKDGHYGLIQPNS